MWYTVDSEYVTLSLIVTPRSSKNSFSRVEPQGIRVKIKAPPVEGEANKELVKFLSKRFKIPKSEIEIISGHNSRYKRVRMRLNDEIRNFIKESE